VQEHDETLNRAIATLREPVHLDGDLDRRIMAEIADGPAPRAAARPLWAGLAWLRRGRTVTVSPLGGLALAAAVAGILLVGRSWIGPDPGTVQETTSATAVIQFVLVAPSASTVSLVGDFNDWDATHTPMAAAAGDGVWSISVPLAPGRYRYAFLVDGSTWLRDPGAPPTLDDDFGRPNSVLTVAGA
jgi:hypothetical protein